MSHSLLRFAALFTAVLVNAALARAASEEIVFKQVAAPASDIVSGRVRLPEPSACATNSQALMTPIVWTWSDALGWSFESTVTVAADGPLSLAVLSTDAREWTIEASRGGAFQPLEAFFGTNSLGASSLGTPPFGADAIERRAQSLGDELPGWYVDRRDVSLARAGTWTVRVTSPSSADGARTSPAPAWWITRDASTIAISAHTSSLSTSSDREVGIVAFLRDTSAARREEPPADPVNDASSARRAVGRAEHLVMDGVVALRGVARSGQVFVETANGPLRLDLFDDGAHDDGVAGDGVFGARLPRWTSGDVRARIELRGVTSSGAEIRRSVGIEFPVVERRAAFSGSVTTAVEDTTRLRIELGALALGPVGQLHVSAEVWGTDAHGQLVPVCWLSRMALPESRGGEWKLPMFLDGRWIAVASAHAPFALANVRVQDPDTHVPYDVVDWMPLPIGALPPSAMQGPTPITTSMFMAPATSASLMSSGSPQAVYVSPFPFQRRLLLVHGYCSSGSIWPAADFTQPKAEFLDPNQNRTHDQFAKLLLQTANKRTSFGVVGHSQGGPAALHLYTYYFSGLDNATGGRRIQSVASPYQGTPLASLGFFACGTNNDMTPAGSTTWLAGIPTWARAEVWYWTTSDNGSACNFLTGLLLTNPEDGTVEQMRGQLPGANSMGHVTGWCHTTGMSYPANYTDHARNALMNANAAR